MTRERVRRGDGSPGQRGKGDIWATEPQAQRPSMAHVEAILDSVLGRIGGGKAPAMMHITSAWQELAGSTWAAATRPVSLDGGKLTVEVEDGAAASRFKFETRQVIHRISAALGPGVVTSIKLRVAGRSRG